MSENSYCTIIALLGIIVNVDKLKKMKFGLHITSMPKIKIVSSAVIKISSKIHSNLSHQKILLHIFGNK